VILSHPGEETPWNTSPYVAKSSTKEPLAPHADGGEMANQLGKVYICGKCGSQVIVTKAGTGTLKCCGAEMEQKK
jgi:desulfoferrodoxin-like iron-binding protein